MNRRTHRRLIGSIAQAGVTLPPGRPGLSGYDGSVGGSRASPRPDDARPADPPSAPGTGAGGLDEATSGGRYPVATADDETTVCTVEDPPQ